MTLLRAPILLAAFLALGAHAARAQTFPERDVRMIVNSQAGGTTDATTRILAEELRKVWGRAVIVENVVGAGGNLGAGQVAAAAPDAHTLLVSHPGPLTVNPLLFKSMAYDPAKLTPISIILSVPNVLVVKTGLDVKTFPEFVSRAKAAPGKLSYGSQGIGSTTHLTAALLARRAGVDLVHVPYRGSPQAIMDLTSGVLDMMFDNLGSALPQHKAGTARIIGVADDSRSPLAPEIPTLEESGLKDFRSVTWFGLVGPPGLQPALAEKISRDVAAVVRSPAYAERVRVYSAKPVGSTPAEAADYMRAEAEVWGGVIRAAGLAPQ